MHLRELQQDEPGWRDDGSADADLARKWGAVRRGSTAATDLAWIFFSPLSVSLEMATNENQLSSLS